jgi:non-ribosomal peptide synthetase-like protein
VTPAAAAEGVDNAEWLGSPAFRLAHRPKVGNFSAAETYQPTRKLYAQRAVVDGLRILIPGYLGLSALVGWVLGLLVAGRWGPAAVVVAAPVAALATGLVVVVVVAILKKLVMRTFKPEIKPLWSMYVWLNEMVNGAYESVTAPFLAPFLGTPFVAPILRLMGVEIGRRVYLATTLFSEWDLVHIGDDVALNHGVVIQNHLFEDRVFKSSHLTIGSDVSVGNMTVILYDSVIEPGSVVGPLSLLMKGETLAADTRWLGIPTAPVSAGNRAP